MSENKRMLTIEDIAAIDDRPEKVVEVPEWGGCVRIKAFSEKEMQDLLKDIKEHSDDNHYVNMRVLSVGVVEPRFTPEHYAMLGERHFLVIERLAQIITKFCGLDQLAEERAQKNFSKTA